jgi:hypothetical protein
MQESSTAVTVVLTSCGRPDLLDETISSFLRWNDDPVDRFLVIEDSADPAVPALIHDKYGEIVEVMVNTPRLGQIRSIDVAYSTVRTPYIFHCEDDWRFYRSGFIRDSLSVIRSDPRIFQVQLRDIWDNNGHPPLRKRYRTAEGVDFRLVSTGFVASNGATYHGFSFNPGLRRLSDYRKIGPYAAIGHEIEISEAHFKAGLVSAILEESAVEHLGDGRHVLDLHEELGESVSERAKHLAQRILPPFVHDSLVRLKRGLKAR